MEIREADVGDAAFIATEFWVPLAEEMEAYSELNHLRADAGEHAENGFRRLLKNDTHRVFLLEADGEDVAYILVETGVRSSRRLGAFLSIVDLYVKEGHRGEGFGTALVEKARAVADAEDCDYITVSAEWDNEPAREFYENLGFEEKQVSYAERR
ncbi:GNAT family N-acetyltransferase [Haladaptatus sp. DYSN1]|uniref:GNAT family N-acetyltransferase n=1 Tax=unclassified Haladaptatus TaxID=2622732 RepID=UPI0024070CF9|nr:GNAT family N-acetyltransferase [Haladaptatus sp. DYSN1]